MEQLLTSFSLEPRNFDGEARLGAAVHCGNLAAFNFHRLWSLGHVKGCDHRERTPRNASALSHPNHGAMDPRRPQTTHQHEIFHILLSLPDIDVTLPDDSNTVLCHALCCTSGYSNVVRNMISSGKVEPIVNNENLKGRTPTDIALLHREREAMQTFRSNGGVCKIYRPSYAIAFLERSLKIWH